LHGSRLVDRMLGEVLQVSSYKIDRSISTLKKIGIIIRYRTRFLFIYLQLISELDETDVGCDTQRSTRMIMFFSQDATFVCYVSFTE